MEPSLTVLLPVRNAQSTLTNHVQKVLEVASELSDRFELVIIDDGSDDATGEIADELIHRYPQVRTVHHGTPLGREAAVQTGLRQSSGEIVLLRSEDETAAVDGIVRLWRATTRHDIPPSPSVGLSRAGIRSAGLRNTETAGRTAGPGIGQAAQAGFEVIDRRSATMSAGEASPPTSRPARPNYLSKLRDFALGE